MKVLVSKNLINKQTFFFKHIVFIGKLYTTESLDREEKDNYYFNLEVKYSNDFKCSIQVILS